MNCSGCGAPLDINDEKCPYCGKITPYGERMFEERKEQEKKKEADNLPKMKYASITAVAILYVITFGIYSPYWCVSRAKSLNELYSEMKFPTWAAWLYLVLALGVFLMPGSYSEMGLTEETGSNILGYLMLVLTGISILMSFCARKILQQHASRFIGLDAAANSVAPSIIMIVICGPVYVQYHVNKLIKMKILAPKI
ncbi:MAG: DUF4234 domain-containing protein [Synergistaceae bacterium]|nr:DUF4234 domain-containing protein [Synergistaceae bacterium]